jgi:hypothetical protein
MSIRPSQSTLELQKHQSVGSHVCVCGPTEKSTHDTRFCFIVFILAYFLLNTHYYIGLEVLTAVTTKSTVFWVVMLRNSERARRFGGTYHLHLQGRKVMQAKINRSRGLNGVPAQKTVLLLTFVCLTTLSAADVIYELTLRHVGLSPNYKALQESG